jgi:uncharacterized protein YbjT (DUF2867 family)
MRVLILGAYGLIGLPVSRRLINDGHDIVGLARSLSRGQALLPDAEFIAADLATLTDPADWIPHLAQIDVVVNASGVLQSGLGNKVEETQYQAIVALIEACEIAEVSRFVQISAPGASVDASTAFFRSKGRADTALKVSSLEWTILRPGLVLSPQSYGGTALLRMLAAMPWFQPIYLADAPVQTIHIDDVVLAISLAVEGVLPRVDVDLVEEQSHRLIDVVSHFRSWLGFPAPKFVWRVPAFIARLSAGVADGLGWLGWQSALRTTAMAVLRDGVTGDAVGWTEKRGQPVATLQQSLRRLASTRQERLAAKAALAYPVMVFILSIFWIVSGVVGLLHVEEAVAVLGKAVSPDTALLFVLGGAVADIIIGIMIAFRPSVRLGCGLSVGLASLYLIGSAVMTPELWSDPLGPMVKILPTIVLAIGVAALSEGR